MTLGLTVLFFLVLTANTLPRLVDLAPAGNRVVSCADCTRARPRSGVDCPSEAQGNEERPRRWGLREEMRRSGRSWCLPLDIPVEECDLHIFIDESGTFAPSEGKSHSLSAVGAIVIPSANMKGFEKLYRRLRTRLRKTKGEVKGRTLSEDEVRAVADILRKLRAIFEVVVIDMGMHSKQDLLFHREQQAKAMTAHLNDDHFRSYVEEVWALRRQLEDMPLQLYVSPLP